MDEINLAAAETLECLSGLLEGSSGSLVLVDRGDTGTISVLAYAISYYPKTYRYMLYLVEFPILYGSK